jgi:PhoH-like ATPase
VNQTIEVERELSGNAIFATTDVFVHDPEAVDHLREDGKNTLFITHPLIQDFDRIQNKPDIGLDAQDAALRIESLLNSGEKSVRFFRNPNFSKLKDILDKKNPKHQILASAWTIKNKPGSKFKEVKLISREPSVRILGSEIGLRTENYYRNDTDLVINPSIKEININSGLIKKTGDVFFFDFDPDKHERHSEIIENEGVVCYSDWNGDMSCPVSANTNWGPNFAAIRKNDIFKVIPKDIGAFGIKQYSINGNGVNWAHQIAFAQLLDPDIDLIFLQGGAGTGKTLLTLAAALEMRRKYHNIVITRPMIHLEDEDKMGFLPGNEVEKMNPWIRPIKRALLYLKNISEDRKKIIEDAENFQKICIESLDYFRGNTYHKDFLFIDDGQNLTPHQFKTIITRAGTGSKVIFTGDLGQIDRKKMLDKKSSGLAYAIGRMSNNPIVGITNFNETVRSRLASLAEKNL